MSGDTINLVPPPAYKSDAWMNAWHSSLVVALYPRRFRVAAEPGKSGIERAERPSAIIRIRLRIK
jgi:hypothetical protein